mmetsp:Transcript_63299/g.108712  ORF Transcript_63299/g.108712 Transcript_63299/m.108712 type:complete len:327 (+) Transcript_63299:58-1038(+)
MNDMMKQSVLNLLQTKSIKPNKLRKLVFSEHFKKEHPDCTWTDFSNTLGAMAKEGLVVMELQEDFSELCVLPSRLQGAAAVTKRPLYDATSKEAKKPKTAVVNKEVVITAETPGGQSVIKKSMKVPAQFVPFLLRESGQKLKNIEVNTKTHIQCETKKHAALNENEESVKKMVLKSPGTTPPDACGGSGIDDNEDALATGESDPKLDVRVLCIAGGTEKHVNAAQILVEAMLEAFHRRNSGNEVPGGCQRGKGVGGKSVAGKGKSGKGRSGKGGKGAKGNASAGMKGSGFSGKRGNGKGEAGTTALSEIQEGVAEAKKKKRERKYY